MKFDGIRVTDSIQTRIIVDPSKKNLENLYRVADAIDDSTSLVVKIPMTHSGLVTRNLGFYQPIKMKSGGKTFTEGFEKPVQVGHGSKGLFSSSDKEPEVIGRVKQVNYVDLSDELLKKDVKLAKAYQQHLSRDQEEQIAGAIALARHIDKKYMKDGLPRSGYQGLGFLEGILNIPDREAAQKIIDGRYNTVSISVGSNAAYCTSCSTNLVQDGGCEHMRGEIVDGHRTLIVLDELRYAHVAVVNEPADVLAANFELVNSITNDCLELESSSNYLSSDHLEVAAKCFMFYNLNDIRPLDTDKDINLVQLGDAIGGITSAMGKKDKTKETKVEDQADLETQDDVTPEEPTVQEEDSGNEPNNQEDNTDDNSADSTEETDNEVETVTFSTLLKDKLELSDGELEYVDSFFEGQELAEDKSEEYLKDFKEFYDSMIDYNELVAEDGYKFFAEILGEDKLSDEALKKLPKSDFCGPNRTIPVPDCKHLDAARELVRRAKVSSVTKSRLVKFMDRKAKVLDCPSCIDTTNKTCDNTTVIQDFSKLELTDLKVWFDKFKEELEARKLFDTYTGLKDLRDQIEILDSQLESAYEELDSYSEREVSYEDSYKDLLAARLVDLKILNGDSVEDKDALLEKLKERSISSLEDSVKDLTDSVDMISIAAKVNNGISREPEGSVESPVLQDNRTEQTPADSAKKAQKFSETSAIYDAYDKMRREYGKAVADKYIEELREKGKLPKVLEA